MSLASNQKKDAYFMLRRSGTADPVVYLASAAGVVQLFPPIHTSDYVKGNWYTIVGAFSTSIANPIVETIPYGSYDSKNWYERSAVNTGLVAAGKLTDSEDSIPKWLRVGLRVASCASVTNVNVIFEGHTNS